MLTVSKSVSDLKGIQANIIKNSARIRPKELMNKYYETIFPWLEECEKIFGYNLKGYGQIRMYTFLAERYLSFWFKKLTPIPVL